jgi:hypothetical protein
LTPSEKRRRGEREGRRMKGASWERRRRKERSLRSFGIQRLTGESPKVKLSFLKTPKRIMFPKFLTFFSGFSITHGTLFNRISWFRRKFGLGPELTFASRFSSSSPIFLLSFLLPLTTGGTIVPCLPLWDISSPVQLSPSILLPSRQEQHPFLAPIEQQLDQESELVKNIKNSEAHVIFCNLTEFRKLTGTPPALQKIFVIGEGSRAGSVLRYRLVIPNIPKMSFFKKIPPKKFLKNSLKLLKNSFKKFL